MNAMLRKGRYRARLAVNCADLWAAQALRHRCFVAAAGALPRFGGLDSDRFDAICTHVLVEEVATSRLVCCFRLLPLSGGAEIDRTYAAQYYGLDALRGYPGRMAEVGRFCVEAGARDPDILRVAWGAMARFVDENAVDMLFGCSSFPGTCGDVYRDSFDLLAEMHLAPDCWLPKVKAPDVVRFAARPGRGADRTGALRRMPPLLRTYLAMGGWVSDHAVVDADLNTLHVFTGLEIAAIPPARARALRAVAG
jgi:putative hemolysin